MTTTSPTHDTSLVALRPASFFTSAITRPIAWRRPRLVYRRPAELAFPPLRLFHDRLPQHACNMSMSTLSQHRRPRLLPQNRKLRHLKGISLRNLSFAPANLQTADDAAIVRSPNKLGSLHGAGQLLSSRSSDTLRTDGLRAEKRRPKAQPRRVSLSLANSNPFTRQKTLESLVESSVGDVFLSLHVAQCLEPVYISEVRHRSSVRHWHGNLRWLPSHSIPLPIGGRLSNDRGRTLTFDSLTFRPKAPLFRDPVY